MAVANEADIRRMVSTAEQARLSGRRDEALSFLAQAQSVASDHPFVLNEAGLQKLHAGDPSAARPLFERAIEKEGKSPTLWLNLASALRKLNLLDDELKALER